VRARFGMCPEGTFLAERPWVKSSQTGTFSPNFDLSRTTFPLGNMVTLSWTTTKARLTAGVRPLH
jgi:hypothetical protein